ncbi:S-adenosyl-L-methionine-dependent methyltransferase [Sesbania bispinosa]|nr:S-adenosyl-L-methionine-dependent methyltransferase [Sesbania bispinosa]
MEWSSKSAARAYLDTLQLCNDHKRQYGTWRVQEPGRNEFVSAIAAGMKAKLIVEVTSHVSPSTIALAAAARQSGGRLVCILPESVLEESKEVIRNSGLIDQVEFRTEDPSKLLPYYENIDFFLVDCKDQNYTRLLNLLSVNPTRSIVVANNLLGDKKGLVSYLRGKDEKLAVRSLRHPLGKGMEVTRISKQDDIDKRLGIREENGRKRKKSSWVAKIDEESGEEHIFRVPQVDWFWS